MKQKKINVKAPATVANLVCGFDILGMALYNPFDQIQLTLLDQPVIRITHTDGFGLPEEPENNVMGVALMAMLREIPGSIGFEVVCRKGIKPGSGIGSSAASAAGAVAGANKLLGNRFSLSDLIRFAMEGEKLASGARHADNVAPAIYGGITLIRSTSELDIIRIPAPELFVTIIHPQIEVKTSDARQILKTRIELKDAVIQWGNVAGLVAGLLSNDYGLISRSLKDVIVEPQRSILIPGFPEVKAAGLRAGALGGGISGSGPALFMMSSNADTANKVEQEARLIYKAMNLEVECYVSTVNPHGVTEESDDAIAIPDYSLSNKKDALL
ncbi:MAG TPA: homoserine kinase [Bacteroidia bacterium]|jgi:homoserine kinase|nr:homoserine kinase [Bacteroidia bacterium]